MSWLARLFDSLADKFWDIGVWFTNLADAVRDDPYIGAVLYSFLADIGYFFWGAADFFWDVSEEVDAWWDWITGIVSDLDDLWDYAHNWLRDKVNDALDLADDAWDKARKALSTAYDAFDYALEQAQWALAAAKEWIAQTYTDIASWVTSHAQDIYNAIKDFIQDAGEWIRAHVQEVYNAIAGFVQDAIAAAMAPLAAPINLVNLWFDEIQDFFNDPADYIITKAKAAVGRLGEKMWDLFEAILEKVW